MPAVHPQAARIETTILEIAVLLMAVAVRPMKTAA
jgi:hypothetical protein